MRHMSEFGTNVTARRLSIGRPQHLPETPDPNGAYPRLSEEQIRVLGVHGERRAVQPGDVLFRDGDQWADFFVVLAGKVAIVEGYESADERLLAVHGPGRFLGELSLLTGQAALYSAVVVEHGEILAVPTARPPLSSALSQETQERLPMVFGGISVALAKTLRILDPRQRRVPPSGMGPRLSHPRHADLAAEATRAGLCGAAGVAPHAAHDGRVPTYGQKLAAARRLASLRRQGSCR
jgi:CRP-like cAMP-binding protein